MIIVVSDTSKFGILSVISHIFSDISEKAIALKFISITSAEFNYCQIKKRCLSIVFAFKKFHYIRYGQHLSLFTDQRVPSKYIQVQERHSSLIREAFVILRHHGFGQKVHHRISVVGLNWIRRCIIKTRRFSKKPIGRHRCCRRICRTGNQYSGDILWWINAS